MSEIKQRIDEILMRDAQAPLTRPSSDEETEGEDTRIKRKKRRAIREYLDYQSQWDPNDDSSKEAVKGLRGRIPSEGGEGEEKKIPLTALKRGESHKIRK